MSQAEARLQQDIHGRIYITIMLSPAITARPASYSKARDTFRPRRGQTATRRADLGGETFVDFREGGAMPNGLVRQLISEARPAHIKNRFRHVGLAKRRCVDVADGDVIEFAHDAVRELVLKVVPAIRGLRLDGFNAPLLVGPLGCSQLLLRIAIEPFCADLLAVAKGREVVQPQVYSNGGGHIPRRTFGSLYANVEEPISPVVAREVRAVFYDSVERQSPALEDLELTAVEVETGRRLFDVAALDWHPTQRLLTTPAQIRPFFLATALCVLLADRIDSPRVQAEFFAATRRQLVEVEPGVPPAPVSQSVFLAFVAEVEDEIYRVRLFVQEACQRLDAVAIDEDHARILTWSAAVMQELRRERYSVSLLIVHLVFVTKYRRKILDDAAVDWLKCHCDQVCVKMGAKLIALDGDQDHLHLMLEYPPKLSISALVNALKGTSSRMLRRHRPDIAKRDYRGVLWCPSYFASSAGGAPLEKVKRYVESQRQKHSLPPSPEGEGFTELFR